MTVDPPSIRSACRRVTVSYTAALPSNRPTTSRLPSGLKDTSVASSVGPPSGLPIACSPLTFQTTAERRCELTRVRPSGLNATSLTGLVSAVSGEPYGAPVFVSHTKTDPSNEAAATSRPSGLRSSEAGGLSPTDSGGRIGRPVRDIDEGHRAGVVARDQRPAALGEDRRLDVFASDHERLPDPAPRGDLPDPDGSRSARNGDPLRIRAEGDRLRAPGRGGFVSIGAAITRPLAASQRVTWLSSIPPAAITEPSGLYRTAESATARGPTQLAKLRPVRDVPQLDPCLSRPRSPASARRG